MLRSTLLMKGWLWQKKQHASLKKKTRRYFTLDTQQMLHCFKQPMPASSSLYDRADQASHAIASYDMRLYRLQVQSDKPLTFHLVHEKNNALTLCLEASCKQEWTQWIDTLEQCVGSAPSYYLGPQTDVLDKWLERFDLMVPLPDRLTPSTVSLAPSSLVISSTDDQSDSYVDIRSRHAFDQHDGMVDDDGDDDDDDGLTTPTPISSCSLKTISSSKSTPNQTPNSKWYTFLRVRPNPKPSATTKKSPSLFFH
ncbi:hypothetical protein BC940DRAFT_305763 [Gongronella butleri]|nr:hypothetical protein BC940DRAFT_305763 [Gongronella butleri]